MLCKDLNLDFPSNHYVFGKHRAGIRIQRRTRAGVRALGSLLYKHARAERVTSCFPGNIFPGLSGSHLKLNTSKIEQDLLTHSWGHIIPPSARTRNPTFMPMTNCFWVCPVSDIYTFHFSPYITSWVQAGITSLLGLWG